jgi:hypothetical protein
VQSRRISNGSAEGSEHFSSSHVEQAHTNGVQSLHQGSYSDLTDLRDTRKPENMRSSGGENVSSDVRVFAYIAMAFWINNKWYFDI